MQRSHDDGSTEKERLEGTTDAMKDETVGEKIRSVECLSDRKAELRLAMTCGAACDLALMSQPGLDLLVNQVGHLT